MREILFRGKRIYNGKWVEGWYEPPVEWDGHKFGTTIAYICKEGYLKDAEVDPSTVGQYTGLTDKNGKRIFEGDVVKWNDKMGRIVFGMGCFCVKYLMPHCFYRNSPAIDIVFHEYPNEVEVIGNIHDNPELLEGGAGNDR